MQSPRGSELEGGIMRRLLPPLVAIAAAALTLGGVALAQENSQFKLGFKTLADTIPNVVGVPLENEHYASNGDSLQQTSTGLMVWRKADNWTAFTDGSESWVNGPNGLQERSNDQRFPWEAQTTAPAATVTPGPSPTATPAPAPSPTPIPKPTLQSSQPNVIQGQGLSDKSVWVLGELRNDGSTPAYNVTVTASLVSSSGAAVGTANQVFAYLGPGDSVGYRIEVANPAPYVRADVFTDSSATGFASYGDVPVQWVKNEQVATQQGTSTYVQYQFTGNLNNTTQQSVSLNAVYAWFLDDQNRVVWADFTYLTGRLVSGDSATFMITTPLDRDNPQVRGITQVRFYAAGQLP